MTEKEILEYAARACGKRLSWVDGVARDTTGFDPAMNVYAGEVWNPLEKIAQCAELECLLEISVYWKFNFLDACSGVFANRAFYSSHPSKQSARMHASTMVAAMIGKEMK